MVLLPSSNSRNHAGPMCRIAPLALLLLLAASLRAEFRRDIEYGQAGGQRLLLDVNIPDGEGPFPIAILIHGGGWSRGDKSGTEKPGDSADITPMFAPLTAARFTWFSINYRHAPAHRWPACYDDVQTAIRWVKAHAAGFKGDPRRIALVGHSAGGHLAFLAAVRATDDTRVQAAVGYAPVTDFEQELPTRKGISTSLQALHGIGPEITPAALALLRETSPVNHLAPASAATTSFLILHGDADKTVPLPQSLAFQTRARALHIPCELIVLPGAPHALATWEQLAPDYPGRLTAWLHQTLAAPPPSLP